MRPVLYFREKKRIREINKTLETVLSLIKRCKTEGYTDTLVVANASLYLIMAELDIANVKVDALTHPDTWKRKLCVRFLILTVFEWKIHHVFGREFRQSLERLDCNPDTVRRLTETLREFRKIHDSIQHKYKYYRDKTIAHREANATEAYKKLKSIDEKEFFELVGDLYSCIGEILQCLSQILAHHGNREAYRKLL